ncbi:MAG: integrase, partial [Gammaproteobacteria bacterium]|nr:integrase [Gammaproteobacteria bacterium]
MRPLRKAMIQAMELRGFSARTHQTYLCTVQSLARYYQRSPDQLSVSDVQAFL